MACAAFRHSPRFYRFWKLPPTPLKSSPFALPLDEDSYPASCSWAPSSADFHKLTSPEFQARTAIGHTTAVRPMLPAFVMDHPALKPRRSIEGISAVLLPFDSRGQPDFEAWARLVERTWSAGLTPAINMDTGYANLLSPAQRAELLSQAGQLARGRRFVAGAMIEGQAGDPVRLYVEQTTAIHQAGGLPILFPCSALTSLSESELVGVFQSVARECPAFLGFELGAMFVPFGRIWELSTFEALLDIPQLKGAKHSSLSRKLEWQRLALRDQYRPDFKLYTGNDLAIDLVMWGSDYLLGLSAFHVEAFAARDRLWAVGDTRFYELNDWLQYLGMLAFRAPVPAYKHTCAQFLHLRGLIPTAEPHPQNPRRPESDLPLLAPIAEKLDILIAAAAQLV